MIKLHADEIFAPLVKFAVPERNGVHPVFFHQRMTAPSRPVNIKLFFEQMIHRRVKIEWKPGRLTDSQTPIQIKTPRTAQKILNLAPTDFKRLFRNRIKNVARSSSNTRFVHYVIFYLKFPLSKLP